MTENLYHDDAKCGSCKGPLDIHRDAICERCAPGDLFALHGYSAEAFRAARKILLEFDGLAIDFATPDGRTAELEKRIAEALMSLGNLAADRIEELEAEVKRLTRLLETQNFRDECDRGIDPSA